MHWHEIWNAYLGKIKDIQTFCFANWIFFWNANFFHKKYKYCLSRYLQRYLFWRVNCASSVYCFFLHRVVMRPRMIFFELDYFFRLHVVLSNLDPVFAFVRPSDVVARTDLELGLKIKATLINWLMCCGRIFPSLINH